MCSVQVLVGLPGLRAREAEMWGDPDTAYGPTLFSLELVLLYLFYTLGICLITHLGEKKRILVTEVS